MCKRKLARTAASMRTFHGVRGNVLSTGTWRASGESERIRMEMNDLVHLFFLASDEAVDIMSLAENVCDGGGYRRFALIETSRGHAVFDAGRFAA